MGELGLAADDSHAPDDSPAVHQDANLRIRTRQGCLDLGRRNERRRNARSKKRKLLRCDLGQGRVERAGNAFDNCLIEHRRKVAEIRTGTGFDGFDYNNLLRMTRARRGPKG